MLYKPARKKKEVMCWGQLQRGTLTTKLKLTPATAQGDGG